MLFLLDLAWAASPSPTAVPLMLGTAFHAGAGADNSGSPGCAGNISSPNACITLTGKGTCMAAVLPAQPAGKQQVSDNWLACRGWGLPHALRGAVRAAGGSSGLHRPGHQVPHPGTGRHPHLLRCSFLRHFTSWPMQGDCTLLLASMIGLGCGTCCLCWCMLAAAESGGIASISDLRLRSPGLTSLALRMHGSAVQGAWQVLQVLLPADA